MKRLDRDRVSWLLVCVYLWYLIMVVNGYPVHHVRPLYGPDDHNDLYDAAPSPITDYKPVMIVCNRYIENGGTVTNQRSLPVTDIILKKKNSGLIGDMLGLSRAIYGVQRMHVNI